jgi:transcriptional coactivator p15 (PC4)
MDTQQTPPRGRNFNRAGDRKKPTLSAPVVVHEWTRNRHGETIRASLVTFNESNLFDLRTWFIDRGGDRRPGKGFAASVHHLPEIARAVNEALEKARELNLIPRG